MMTARFAVGSVSTLAMAALLLGSASLLLNRPGSAAHSTPWGDIASLSPASVADAATSDKAQLLKLAALKTNPDMTTTAAAPVSPATPAASEAVAAAVPAPTPAPVALEAATAAPAAPSPVADAEPTQAAPVQSPVQMASAADPESSDASPAPVASEDDAPARGGLINLNRASADALDHIPGLGRVGRSIVAHRPYRSVKDLVNKRVLRTSDFQKIESHVRVD
jgi:DNA uptake protein ComE-like DNA-binding protein